MKRFFSLVGSVLLLIGLPSLVFAAFVDLSSWTAEGNGNWTVAGDNNSVFQSINGSPTVFYSDFDGQGKALSGKITAPANWDDDFIGFVLGFQPGDISAPSTDFILIDWKQGDQYGYGATGLAGLAISHVNAGLPSSDAWTHQGSVTELARATTLGSTGWIDGTTYDFELIFNSTNIQVSVDGTKELDIFGSFADGRFGFYNNSQEGVRYFALEEDLAPPAPPAVVPEPATMLLLGFGIIGLAGLGRKKFKK